MGHWNQSSLRLIDSPKQPVVGVVVIGRNEGERLKRCLRSLVDQADHIVYVDSGSTDGSGDFARSIGVDVVELDMTKPFSMARGRNTGASHLIRTAPNLDFIQFVDGDCEVDKNWIGKAVSLLLDRAEVVAVCGRRRERHPEASIYNRLMDMEWNTPIGEARACGGDSMMRSAEFQRVGGFNDAMIAGEEPELCVRLRQAGGVILREDAEMTLHDAAMWRFGQWWKRAMRGGHAYAEGAAIHGRGPLRYNVQQMRSTLFWGAAVPFAGIGCAVAAVWQPVWLAGTAVVSMLVVVQWARIVRGGRARGFAPEDARLYSTFCLIGKAAGALGVARYWLNRILGRRSGLIEYKRPGPHEAITKPA